MRAIICGSRHYTDRDALYVALDRIHAETPITRIIEGGAKGADSHAYAWSLSRGVSSLTISAEWGDHGRAAGPMRNRAMLAERPDVVIAFMDGAGPGTRNMVAQARKAGVRVLEIGCTS